ncbi:HSP20-like chaperone [Bombardia bombarda]|uniref:HSP20-like chaperone n=1 Tax=Bombardia bombarda TaxID=252184 RepID=A0AA39TZU3_9PEZI|nr:HSP20-like chaperone [Bombardia bombarda]
MSTTTQIPEVLWAQRSSPADPEKNFIYLTISVPDVPASDLKLDIKPTGLTFTGRSDSLKRTYHLELEFYAEIDPEASRINHTSRDVEMKLRKKDLSDAYWPRLLKESKKVHFLKTDFDKWVDEDEQDEATEDDFSNFGGMEGMPGMGGMGGGGMEGMGGMGGNDFSGIDFSKLSGAGGMPGGEDDESDDDDDDESDDDMPALMGEEEADEEIGTGGKKAETKA